MKAIVLFLAASLCGLCLPSYVIVSEVGESIENPLDISGAERITITQTRDVFVALGRSGGTAFFWNFTIQNPEILQVRYVRSITEPRQTDTPVVGLPERDVFLIRGLKLGHSTVRFTLAAVNSPTIRTIETEFQVISKGRE
jgi:hypothetical protein